MENGKPSLAFTVFAEKADRQQYFIINKFFFPLAKSHFQPILTFRLTNFLYGTAQILRKNVQQAEFASAAKNLKLQQSGGSIT